MWIECIELDGFGNLANQRIEFKKDKLNLVAEANEYGKSTIAEAIWAVLYDYPSHKKNTDNKLKEREARKPLSGAQFKASLYLIHQDRQLLIARDFGERIVKVYDRGRGNIDVTREFITGPNDSDIGLKLTGMGRELFRKTCFVGQGDLLDYELSGDRDLTSLLQSMADSSGSGGVTAADAIAILEDKLTHFYYNGKKYRIDKIIRELEDHRDKLAQKIATLENERMGVSSEFKRLNELNTQLEQLEKQIQSIVYSRLMIEQGEYDAKLIRAKEKLLRVRDLKHQFDAFRKYADFPIEHIKRVEDLWATREARKADVDRQKNELITKEKNMAERDQKLQERWKGLQDFTTDDAQALGSTARTLQTVLSELNDAKKKCEAELKSVKEDDVDVDNLAGIRKSLLNLEARDYDDAYAYNAMIVAAREGIGGCELAVWRARMDATQANEQRNLLVAQRKNLTQKLAMLTGVMVGIGGVSSYLLKLKADGPIALAEFAVLGVLLVALIISSILMVMAQKAFQIEIDRARQEEQRQSQSGQELHNKVMGHEVKLEDLARKAGISSGVELVKLIQAYASTANRLKDLDLLEQVISSRETQSIKLKNELEGYFTKAGRKGEDITPEAALKLAESITLYLDERRNLQSSVNVIDDNNSGLAFLVKDLEDIDNELKQCFTAAKLTPTDNVEQSYKQFYDASIGCQQWQVARTELEKMEKDTTSEFAPSELSAIIEKLKIAREGIYSQLQDMVDRNPLLSDLPAAMTVQNSQNSQDPNFAKLLADLETASEKVRKERENLTVHVRASTKDYDDDYLGALDEKEGVERDLAVIQQAKTALELARDSFKHLSQETHAHWSQKLNELAGVMLSELQTDYESLHFDADLNLTARKRGQSEPLQPANIKSQLSMGVREQLHWLARLSVTRFLSRNVFLPIILDEPFSEADDRRFLNMMRFLIGTLLKEHQIILFSCHQSRHRWLLDQLEQDYRSLMSFPKLEPRA